jgi:hypothetical protein
VIARILKYLIAALLFLLGLGGVLVEGTNAINGEWQDPFFGTVLTVSFFTLGVFALLAARSYFRVAGAADSARASWPRGCCSSPTSSTTS